MELTGDTVDVWRVDLRAPPATVRFLERTLDGDERERMHRRGDPSLRRRYTVAHGAKRCVVAGYTGAAPAELRWRRGRYGKPELCGRRPVRTSLTHAGDLALVAVSAVRDVGVDVEQPRDAETAVRLADRYFPAAEARLVRGAEPADRAALFARLWTRKEACVKATGGKLAHGLRLPVAAGDPPLLTVRDLSLPARWVAAVALRGDAPFTAVVHDWAEIASTVGCQA
ncbi:4'-phosphopantetheinyl transferase family protein [Plantactinospora sp. KLBMP9567]|uniref:4'-phosphopantetheinyl transferase family protein n=1 Tax=Plantactinospora sp. KLBMP9567 TaxID=3085900 RepID=UPI0029821D14|nr:4'-phosphopantetheinyl transferase superfamily protein [Plantactinospora sp. KLBMP9567]MDW5329522.1 4'-phosphopantetheinyl transferase superfamily protein [Plantactinospora sp. KLBMP9567]